MMIRLSFLYAVIISIILPSCNGNKDTDSVKLSEDEQRIANIIRNPVSAEGAVDTINIPKITFKESVYHFGNVTEGDVVKASFEFTNTGKIPLLIADARASCGCTVPKWPKESIDPGEGGTIYVEFDTNGKKYDQNRPISIIANTLPRQTDVILTGHVTPK
jgi:hypothetical protein